MESLLPVWIIGAPLVLMLVDLMRTPKVTEPGTTRLGREELPAAR